MGLGGPLADWLRTSALVLTEPRTSPGVTRIRVHGRAWIGVVGGRRGRHSVTFARAGDIYRNGRQTRTGLPASRYALRDLAGLSGGRVDQSSIRRSRDVGARWRRSLRLLWIIPTVLATAVLGLQQAGVWTTPPGWLIWTAVITSSVTLLVEAVVEIFRGADRQGVPYGSGDRQKFMSSSAAEIHLQTGLPFASLGISLWVVHTPHRHRARVRRLLSRTKDDPDVFLYRLERFRVADPTETNESWPRGRGMIGACVRDNKSSYRDYRPLQRAYPEDATELSATQWKRICRDGKDDGFEMGSFLRISHRYEQVLAYPITDDGQVVGCISVDVTSHPDQPEGARLDSPQVVRELHRLATFMAVTATKLAVRP